MGNKHWTFEETRYLEENWGEKSLLSISKKLGRTLSGTRHKAYTLGLMDNLHNSADVTLYEFTVNILRLAHNSKFVNILKQKSFPLYTKKYGKRDVLMVNLDKFYEWLNTHRHDLFIGNTEKGDLGVEPEWVNDLRKLQKLELNFKHDNWTKQEDERLKYLVSLQRYTYFDLVEKLNRNQQCIKRRLCELKVLNRPLPIERKNWAKDEKDKAIKLYNDGASIPVIARYFITERSERSLQMIILGT